MSGSWLTVAVALTCFSATFGQVVVINSTDCGDGSMSFWALWTTWSGFGACDVSCLGETGERSRQRIQTCPVKVDNCDAAKVEVEYYECEGMDPPVDGGYGQWSHWKADGPCSVFCGGSGFRREVRTRECNDPPPSCNGTDCMGKDRQFRREPCRKGPCGGLCHPRQRVTVVLMSPRLPDYYAKCLRGKVSFVKCPKMFDLADFPNIRRYNLRRIRRLCNI